VLTASRDRGRRMGKALFVYKLERGESGKVFGAVTAKNFVNRLKNNVGADIHRHKIVLERPIKDTGEHEVAIKLHHDVTAQLVFQVKSAAEPKADATPTGMPEEPDKRKRRIFHRKKDQPKQEEK